MRFIGGGGGRGRSGMRIGIYGLGPAEEIASPAVSFAAGGSRIGNVANADVRHGARARNDLQGC